MSDAHLVVVDTNVWISGILTREGAPARVVRHVMTRGIPVFSFPTFAEFESRIRRPKFDRYISLEMRRQILHDLSAAALWVDIPPDLARKPFCRDTDDDMFIHTALAARAPWLVTGDKDLLDVCAIPQLHIVSPAAALELADPLWRGLQA
ncbi:MAG: putative toxin-antitoxin system toxin component, PIN family [Desulfovibrionales bacterium]